MTARLIVRPCVMIVTLTCLVAGSSRSGWAAVVDLINSSAFGTSWDLGANWSDGQPAHAGNDYRVGFSPTNRSLRTPNNVSDPVFPGDSLTIYSTGTLGMKHYGNAQIADLRLDGGDLGAWVGNRTFGFDGTLTVLSPSTLRIDNTGDSRRIVIASFLTGSGDLEVLGSDSNDWVRLTNSANTYTGNWTVTGGRLEAQGAGSLGTGNVTVQSGAQIDVDYDINNTADWSLGGTMVLDQNHTIGALTVGGNVVATGTYSYDLLNRAFDVNFAAGGSGSITVTSSPIAGGTVYELNKNQPYGNSWNTGDDWTNTGDGTTGVVPPLGTIANAATGLRTPMGGGTHVFAATLNLMTGGVLGLKTTGTAVLADGHLQGGALQMSVAPNSTGTIGGQIAVDSDSEIRLISTPTDHRTIILSADLSGSGNLDVFSGTGTGTLRLTGDNSAYSGDWLVRDFTVLQARSADALGSGSLTLNNQSTLAPGGPIGMADIGADFTMSASTLQIEINGLDQGDQGNPGTAGDGIGYDFVRVGGDAVLNGDLVVSLLGGFQPAVGDTFDVLQVGGNWSGDLVTDPYGHLLGDRPGAGSWSVRLVDLPGGGHIFRLTAVPEPSGLLLAGLGLAALVGFGRRKRFAAATRRR